MKIADSQSTISTAVPVSRPEEEVQANRLKKACADFEAIFVRQLLRSSKSAFSEGGLLGQSRESKSYQDMSDDQLAQAVTRGPGLGIGKLLHEQLTSHRRTSVGTELGTGRKQFETRI